MLINITTKKYIAIIDYVNDKNITLKAGATLGTESPSLSASDKAIRNAILTSGTNTTHSDYTFKSTSSVASVIVGSPQSGKRFFAKYLTNQQTTTSSSNTQNAETTNKDDSTTSGGEAPINNNVKPDALAKNIICFCKDFEFQPDPRMLNTMYYIDSKKVNEYIQNCMDLRGGVQPLLSCAEPALQQAFCVPPPLPS